MSFESLGVDFVPEVVIVLDVSDVSVSVDGVLPPAHTLKRICYHSQQTQTSCFSLKARIRRDSINFPPCQQPSHLKIQPSIRFVYDGARAKASQSALRQEGPMWADGLADRRWVIGIKELWGRW